MGTKKNSLLLILISLTIVVTGQQQGLREANLHFKQQNYEVALDIYEKLWKADTTNIELNYNLGLCYLNCNKNPARANHYLLNAERKMADDAQFNFYLAKSFLYKYDFSNAKSYFEKCKNLSAKDIGLQQNCDLWMSYLANAKKLKQSPLDVSFVNMGKYINSEMDELTPFTTPDNEILLYTSNQKYDRQFFIYTFDVYMSNLSNGIFKKGKSLSTVNSVDDEFMAGVSLSNERIFVQLQGYEAFKDIIYTERNGNGFQGKSGINSAVNSKQAEYGAYETINSDTLFFSSDRDGGFGGMDLYYSLKLPTGDWAEPKNLGSEVNTPYNEDFPVLANNGGTLYFTSDRPESMGGFDIFKCSITSTRQFSQPQNIGYPLNDVFDNQTIAFSENDRYAYVSAIRPDGIGFTDIYRVVFNQEDPSVKIYILEFKTQEGDTKIPYAQTDTTLQIHALQKGKVIFGEYAYHAKSSQTTIALPPGLYNIEIKGKETEEESLKITVPDEPSEEKIEKLEVILKTRNK